MKVTDIIFALICGKVVGFVLGDILRASGISIGIYYFLLLWIVLPVLALFCLWVASIIGRKLLFVYQGAKHLLVGAFATVIDLKVFEFLLFILSFLSIVIHPLLLKGASFLFSTSIKYWGNKYWTFGKHEKENWHREAFHFFLINFVGVFIDVGTFHFFTDTLGPQFGATPGAWLKVSVIAAAAVAAIWNFSGDKFLVFKK